MPTPVITFAFNSKYEYETIEELVEEMRGAQTQPFGDVTATIRIGADYVDLPVPFGVYSRFYGDVRRWRTPTDVNTRESAWRARLRGQMIDLAKRL